MSSAVHEGSSPSQVFDPSYDLTGGLNVGQFLTDIYMNDLRPYEDNALLNQRLSSESRILRQTPEIIPLIEEAISGDDDDTIIAVADLLNEGFGQKRLDKLPAIATCLSYLTISDSVSLLKNRLHGENAPAGRANAITQILARRLSARIPDDRVMEFWVSGEYLAHRLKHLEKEAPQPRIDYNFIRVKLLRFIDDLKFRGYGLNYIDAIPTAEKTAPTVEQIVTDSQQVADAFTAMRASQQYGIKLGYKPHRLGGSLIFGRPPMTEVADFNHPNIHPLAYVTPAVAEIIHSNQRSFKHLKPKIVEMAEDAFGYNYDGVGFITHFYLGPDGELFADRHCDVSMRDMFIRKGKYAAYRELHADILAGYFDMTHSAEQVNQITRDKATIKPNTPIDPASPTDPMDAFQRLVIPRIQPMQPASNSQPAADKPEPTSRKLRYHGVAWHRRTLPEGWSASPQAREMAAAMGIELKDNETFVAEHHRGSKEVGEVVGHLLVERD